MLEVHDVQMIQIRREAGLNSTDYEARLSKIR